MVFKQGGRGWGATKFCHLVTIGVDGTARILDLASREQIAVLRGHEGPVLGVAFNAAGDRLATSGSDRRVVVWDVTNPTESQPLLTFSGHRSDVWGTTFSPDGNLLATISSDASVKLWDVSPQAEAEQAAREVLSLRPGNDGREVTFSPDGRFIAATGSSGAVRVYVTSTAELLALARSRLTRDLTTAECLQYLHEPQCPATP